MNPDKIYKDFLNLFFQGLKNIYEKILSKNLYTPITQLVLHVLCTSRNLTTTPQLCPWLWMMKRLRAIVKNYSRAWGDFCGNSFQKTKFLSQIPLLGCHFCEDSFCLRGTRRVPPTLVLRAQCSTYLYIPNLHYHERSEWSWWMNEWMMMMMRQKVSLISLKLGTLVGLDG